MDQTSTIHSVDTGFSHVVFKLSFSRQYKTVFYFSVPGVANQSETKSHISYCVTAKSHIIHMGAHEHHLISPSLTHVPLLS